MNRLVAITAFLCILNQRIKCDTNSSITSIKTAWTERIVKGIPSGGNTIRVEGSNLDAVQEATIYVTYNSHNYTQTCEISDSSHARCKFPKIPVDETIDADEPLSLSSGIGLDDKYYTYPALVYPDPKYYEFEDKDRIKYYKSDYLTINGENLDRAITVFDVTVQIGTGTANVTSLSRSQLTCRPPETQPPALNSDGSSDDSQLPKVVVIVGDNLRFEIGYLSYESPVSE